MNRSAIAVVLLVTVAAFVRAETSAPATRPAEPSAERKLESMLGTSATPAGAASPAVRAAAPPSVDSTSGEGAVAPGAPQLRLQREGTFVFDRTGRLDRSADDHYEFVYEGDNGMAEPPLVLLPNLKLMGMEAALKAANRDLRFRITGELTEYKGRNYILLHKFVVIPDSQQVK